MSLRLAWHALLGRPILHRVEIAGGIVTVPDEQRVVISRCKFYGAMVRAQDGCDLTSRIPTGERWETKQ